MSRSSKLGALALAGAGCASSGAPAPASQMEPPALTDVNATSSPEEKSETHKPDAGSVQAASADDQLDGDGARERDPAPEPSFDPRKCDAFLAALEGRRPSSPAPGCTGPARDRTTGERDAAAEEAIKSVVFNHYLAHSFESIPWRLLRASRTCEDKCSTSTQARLWMYTGVVYGSGMINIQNAYCAFSVAIRWEPEVVPDRALMTPATSAAFDAARREICGEEGSGR